MLLILTISAYCPIFVVFFSVGFWFFAAHKKYYYYFFIIVSSCKSMVSAILHLVEQRSAQRLAADGIPLSLVCNGKMVLDFYSCRSLHHHGTLIFAASLSLYLSALLSLFFFLHSFLGKFLMQNNNNIIVPLIFFEWRMYIWQLQRCSVSIVCSLFLNKKYKSDFEREFICCATHGVQCMRSRYVCDVRVHALSGALAH